MSIPAVRRKRPGLEEKEDCDCCPPDCDCGDCERCKEDAVQVARDWIPPPAKGTAAGTGARAATSKGKKAR